MAGVLLSAPSIVTAQAAIAITTACTVVYTYPSIVAASLPSLKTNDPLNRLTAADYSSGESFAYEYDGVGNRTVFTQTLGPTTVTTYTYDAANRLTAAGNVEYTWDARGNLTHDGTFTYAYNAAGRLVRARRGEPLLALTATLVYTYTADGLRMAQSVNGEETTFAWDTALPLAQVLATSDGALDLYGLGRIGELQDGEWAYPLPDALGSVRQWTDDAGNVDYAAGYTPYGQELWQAGSTESAWGYTGEWSDPNAGMVYLRARWYDGYLNQFISPDTIVPDFTNPQSINRYTYVLKNPIRYTDPSGYIKSGSEAEEALRIIKQLQNDYVVTIPVDFGWEQVPVMHPAPGERVACSEWEEGAWRSVVELKAVLEVAQRYEDKAGSAQAAQRAIGGVTIERISQGAGGHHAGMSLITLGDNVFYQSGGDLKRVWAPKVAIAHELAHYWDWKTGDFWSRIAGEPGAIVEGMAGAIQREVAPTWYARTSIVEDWAESVAGYLFPEYFTFLVEEGDPRENRIITLPSGRTITLPPGLGPRHYAYVAAQFRALSVSTP